MSKDIMSSIELMDTLTKTKKQKSKVNRRGRGRRVEMKVLLKSKNIKKAKTEQLTTDLLSNWGAFEKEIKKCYGGNGGNSKILEDREDVVELLTNKKFAKALIAAIKELKDSEEIPYVILFAIGDMFVNNDEAFVEDEKLSKKYMKLFDAFYGKKIKKLAKKMKISKTDALALYLTSLSFKDVKAKFIFKRTLSFLKLLYDMEDLDIKKAKIALTTCYGKRMSFALSAILNENAKTSESFSIVTNAALEIMNKMDREDLKELLKRYAKRRKGNPKVPRRIALSKINEDDYKNVLKVIDKLIKTGFNKELFM